MTYIAGDPYRICDRCGLRRRVSTTSKEWTGLMVCAECRDPRPAEMSPPVVSPEGLPIRDPRPETDRFLEVNQVQPEDL